MLRASLRVAVKLGTWAMTRAYTGDLCREKSGAGVYRLRTYVKNYMKIFLTFAIVIIIVVSISYIDGVKLYGYRIYLPLLLGVFILNKIKILTLIYFFGYEIWIIFYNEKVNYLFCVSLNLYFK